MTNRNKDEFDILFDMEESELLKILDSYEEQYKNIPKRHKTLYNKWLNFDWLIYEPRFNNVKKIAELSNSLINEGELFWININKIIKYKEILHLYDTLYGK